MGSGFRIGRAAAVAAVATAASLWGAWTSARAQEAAAFCGEHVVAPGDTLGAVARTHLGRPDVAALMAVNADRLKDPDSLRVGQVLRLPCRSGETAAGETAEPGVDAAEPAGSGTDAGSRIPARAAFPPPGDGVRVPTLRPAAPEVATKVAEETAAADQPDPGDKPAADAAPSEPEGGAPTGTPEIRLVLGGDASAYVDDAEILALLTAAYGALSPPRELAATRVERLAAGSRAAPGRTRGGLDRLEPFGTMHLAAPWLTPDCTRMHRLTPAYAARCARYDRSEPLAVIAIRWFAPRGGVAAAAEGAAVLRGLRICRPEGVFDMDLQALGLKPPRTARLSPETAVDCLRMVALGRADAAALPAPDARAALDRLDADPPEWRESLVENAELADAVSVRALSHRASPQARAAMIDLNRGLSALGGR